MAAEMSFEDKGSVRPKTHDAENQPQKSDGHLNLAQVQGKLNPATVSRLQRTLGNQAVQRLLAQRSADGEAEVDDETTTQINARRGQGGQLDEGVASKAGAAMGHDFSQVNVHTDSHADQLSQQLNAQAFTIGNDVFFREGSYNPGSSDGQRLIAHELTHVVQQGASPPAVQGKLTVNDPNDQFEAEADQVAESVMNMPEEGTAEAGAQRQPMEEEEEMLQPKLQRQEEEELAQTKLQREEVPEEEMQAKLQREEVPEEEMQAKLQREEMPEDELQTKLQRQEELPEEEI